MLSEAGTAEENVLETPSDEKFSKLFGKSTIVEHGEPVLSTMGSERNRRQPSII